MKITAVLLGATCDQITMSPVCKTGPYPADGSDEDNTFAKFSPAGELKLTIANPALLGKFRPDQVYYLDFTRANAPIIDEVKLTPAEIELLAGRAYTQYCAAVGGVAFNGDPLPAWEDFSADPTKEKQANGWRAVALGITAE